MELREFVSSYDGEVLFTVKEQVGEGELSTIISFKSGEHEALREDLLMRNIENYKVDTFTKNSGVGRTYESVIIIILSEKVVEEETA